MKKSKKYLILLLILFLLPFSIETVDNVVVAKNLRHKHFTHAACLPVNLVKDKLPYIFKVSDKLIGNGEIDIVVEDNKITGKAIGIGMTALHIVDLTTNIEGILSDLNFIDVTVTGTGDPQGLIPGKISFSGPLKGEVGKNELVFKGRVNIDGKLARCAGFNETEEISIEIQGDSLIKAYNKQKSKQEKLASL